MKRIILAALLSLLIIPAAASARTPVSGGLKQTILQSYAQAEQVNPTPHQIAACFDVYTVGGIAYVIGGANSRSHNSWYQLGGLCESGSLYNFQPDHGLLRHKSSAGGYWHVLLTFDQIAPSQLRHIGISLTVFENVSNTKPPNYPFVP